MTEVLHYINVYHSKSVEGRVIGPASRMRRWKDIDNTFLSLTMLMFAIFGINVAIDTHIYRKYMSCGKYF